MNKDRNCGYGNNFAAQPMPAQPMYQPVMPMTPMMPLYGNYNSQYPNQDIGGQTIESRINNLEKRVSILEANLNGQSLSNGFNNTNYQII